MSKVLPVFLFFLSLLIGAFAVGLVVAEFKLPPYRSLHAGAKTLRHTLGGLSAPPYLGQFLGADPAVKPDQAEAARFSGSAAEAAYTGNILVIGGLNEYLDVCPDDGCIAVEMDREGSIVRGIPFLPDDIFAADATNGSFYREAQPTDPRLIFRPIGMQPLPDGDILVSFQTTGSMFPYSGGVARIDPDGHPRWYRFDYSHHWVSLSPDGRVLVPDLELGTGNWNVLVGPTNRPLKAYCETDRPMVDGIQELDVNGNVVARYDINRALRASPWNAILVNPFEACDPLHLNYVDVLDETAPGGDLAPGNLLISSRNLSAILVYNPKQDKIVRIVKGSFQQQHSAHHLEGSKVLLFDNWGAAGAGQGSRLLEVDLAGGPERQIFPPAGTADPTLYSGRAGLIDISPDRTRTMVSFTEAGIGVEVDLATGTELLRYNSLHDLSEVAGAPEKYRDAAVRSKLFGMYYLAP